MRASSHTVRCRVRWVHWAMDISHQDSFRKSTCTNVVYFVYVYSYYIKIAHVRCVQLIHIRTPREPFKGQKSFIESRNWPENKTKRVEPETHIDRMPTEIKSRKCRKIKKKKWRRKKAEKRKIKSQQPSVQRKESGNRNERWTLDNCLIILPTHTFIQFGVVCFSAFVFLFVYFVLFLLPVPSVRFSFHLAFGIWRVRSVLALLLGFPFFLFNSYLFIHLGAGFFQWMSTYCESE